MKNIARNGVRVVGDKSHGRFKHLYFGATIWRDSPSIFERCPLWSVPARNLRFHHCGIHGVLLNKFHWSEDMLDEAIFGLRDFTLLAIPLGHYTLLRKTRMTIGSLSAQ